MSQDSEDIVRNFLVTDPLLRRTKLYAAQKLLFQLGKNLCFTSTTMRFRNVAMGKSGNRPDAMHGSQHSSPVEIAFYGPSVTEAQAPHPAHGSVADRSP